MANKLKEILPKSKVDSIKKLRKSKLREGILKDLEEKKKDEILK